MNTPTPLRQTAEEPMAEVGRLAERARPVPEWTSAQRADAWRGLEAQLQPAPRRWLTALALVAAAPAGAVAMAALLMIVRPTAPDSTAARRVDLGAVGELVLSPSSVLTAARDEDPSEDRRVYLASGSLRAHIARQEPGRRFVVVTPHVRVVVVGTRFAVAVSGGLSTVSVDEGRIRVESLTGGEVLLGVGERVRSDDPRLSGSAGREVRRPEAPSPAAAPTAVAPRPREAGERCESKPSGARRRGCWEGVAAGEGLEAENALYALGLMASEEERDPERALEHWRMHERRFPAGTLAPEVSLAVLRELLGRRLYSEALAQAESFEARFPSDPRRPDVALIRANLLCLEFGQAGRALASYAEALAGTQAQRGEALWSQGLCEDAMGRAAEAARTWSRYRDELPDGPRAAEIRGILGN